MSTDVDVIVVGGGPVGLAAAIEARLAGLSVTIVEPREGTIDKACGEGLMPGAIPLLERLGVRPQGMPLRGVSYRARGRVADHRFATGEGLGVRRLVLHDALRLRAEELGVGRVRERVTSVHQGRDSVIVAGLHGRYLLAADGLHSTVRRAVGLESAASRFGRRGAPGGRGQRFGLRQHFRVAPWNDFIEVHWSEGVEAYITPVAPDIIGLAMLGARGTDFDETLAKLPELRDRLAGAEPASSLRGAGVLRQRALRPSAGRVLLVGDASGYVDAITGEGLRLGFEQASVAVASIVAGAPGGYDAEWRRVTRDFRVLTTGLVVAASSPLRGAIVPFAARMPRLYGAVVERLAR